MFRSQDGGDTWHETNEGIIYKEIWWMEQHPATGELYAGTGPASVFKSVDGGDTWQDCPQLRSLPETIDWTFPPPPHIAHVKGLALTPDDPNRIFGAVEEGPGRPLARGSGMLAVAGPGVPRRVLSWLGLAGRRS